MRKDYQLVVRLTETERQKLDEMARCAELTPSETVRRVLGAVDSVDHAVIVRWNLSQSAATSTLHAGR